MNDGLDGTASRRSLLALDWLNFFLADVQGGIGPYLAIYLLSVYHWDASSIGIAMSAAGIASVAVQTPAGALIDRAANKRAVMAAAVALIGLSCLMMTQGRSFWLVIGAQSVIGVAAAVIGPGVAALSLGLVGYDRLARRMGRNQVFNHSGNIAAAAATGLLASLVAHVMIFYLVAAIAVLTLVALLLIRRRDMDDDLARGAGSDHGQARVGRLSKVLTDRRIVMFAAAVVLFHFANAAMLPLVGQYLAIGNGSDASLYMSACIITAQLVMAPMAAFAGRFADRWGRKPVFLTAFLALPLRGVLYTFSANPFYLVAIQILDGVANGIFGVVNVLMVADLTRGSGRYNVTQGAIATAIGIGATLSNAIAGVVVGAAGYRSGFLFLAAVALVALALFFFGVRESRPAAGGDTAATRV